MNVLSLCSGAGGLELGLRLAVPSASAVAYVERDACAIEVLAARMEDGSLAPAPIWFDLGTFSGEPLAGYVDAVAAGFPCQPHSVAGKRAGVTDERWLWDEVWRVVREVRSPLLFVENVPGLLTSGGFDRVLADLAASGWSAEWDCVPAAAVGAPHLRDRVFLLAADADRAGFWKQPVPESGGGRAPWLADAGADGASADPSHESTGAELGQQHGHRADVPPEGGTPTHADAHGERPQAGRWQGRADEPQERADADRGGNGWGGRPAPEPCVRRMDDGASARMDGDRLFVLGNGVVPQAAARAWRTLWGRLMEP